jgi:hypothetical protein
MLFVLGLCVLTAAPVSERLFVSPLRADDGVEEPARLAVEEALLIAARARHVGVVSSADVGAILDLEAAQQVAGCDTRSCEAELADALGAPELVTGQLLKVGSSTWVLSLKRLRREDMRVVASHQLTREGSHPLVIVSAIDELADVVIGPKPSRPWRTAGTVMAGVGVVVGGLGGLSLGVGWAKYLEGTRARDDGNLQKAFETRRDFEWTTPTGATLIAVGGAVVVVGLSLVAADLLREEAL